MTYSREHMKSRRLCLMALIATTLVLVLPSSLASAGAYQVHACDPAYGDSNHAWFAESSTTKMTAYATCPVAWNEGRIWNRGLVTRHGVSADASDTVPGFSYSALRFRAPAGATIARITYSHSFCGGQDFKAGLFSDTGQNLHVAQPGSCGTFIPSPWTFALTGTHHSILLMTMCARAQCNVGSKLQAWATLRTAIVWVQDTTRPSVAAPGGSIATSGWHRGDQSVLVRAQDNVGLRYVDVYLDSKLAQRSEARCDWTYVVPCRLRSSTLSLNSRLATDGRHTLTTRVFDSALNAGVASVPILVDNTPPAGPLELGVAGGESWRNENSFSLSWVNPPQKGVAPITSAAYAICPSSNASDDLSWCASGRRAGAGIHAIAGLRVPYPGDWVARVWLRDAAGNLDRATARSVHLRYDPSAPTVAILSANPADPQRVGVRARDGLSHLARVEVEVRRDGTASWISLPVSGVGSEFVAYVDDSVLPAGRYVVRARAVDAAGNERTAQTRVGGAPAALRLPLRLLTHLELRGVRHVTGRHGRVKRVAKRSPLVAYGERLSVVGRLTLPGDNALAGVPVEVFDEKAHPGEPWRRVGIVRTNARGRFSYRPLRGPSRVLRFAYPGSPLIQPRTAAIRLRVQAATSFHVNRRHVVNGEEVVFRGRVRGPMPEHGKLLQLQAYSRGTWRTFATPRARKRTHRWRYPYRFSATRGTVRYRFRAVVPPEAGFPFERGYSRSLHVVVRGV